jgi:hypothetical protein
MVYITVSNKKGGRQERLLWLLEKKGVGFMDGIRKSCTQEKSYPGEIVPQNLYSHVCIE